MRARMLISLLALVLIVGCVGGPTVVPEDVYYRLPEPGSVKAMARPLVEGRLGVDRIETDGLHQERALLYVDADRPHELRRYHYHYWTGAPGRVVQDHLIAYLRAADAAGAVSRHEPDTEVDAVVTGRLLRFERVLDGGAGVAVTVELTYREPAAGPLRLRREYTVRRPARNETMAATVEAFGTALQAAYGEFLAELTDAE